MFGEIRNAQGERIDYTFHPGAPSSKYIFVLGHGVTGNKDRPFVVALAEGLGRANIPALRISFPGNGTSGGKFTDCTLTKEVVDLGAVFDILVGYRIGYVGHSMGAAVGVLRASKDDRVRFLVSLAGMVHTRAFAEREFGNIKPDEGFMWEEPNCPLSTAYMDDMKQVNSVVDLASKIRVPWLFVHGTEDDVVPIQDSRDIFAKAHEPKKLIEIKAANHVFAGEHTAPMVEHVVNWVKARVS